MSEDSLPKIVFNELENLDNLGFSTWLSCVKTIANAYRIDLCNCDYNTNFVESMKRDVISTYQRQWMHEINDSDKNPLLRTYKLFKNVYRMEPYLRFVKNYHHRIAMSRLRCSSHMLEIERGRHSNPVVPSHERLCPVCGVLENEIHFLLFCKCNESLRQKIFQ